MSEPVYFETLEEAKKNKKPWERIIFSISPDSTYPDNVQEYGYWVEDKKEFRILQPWEKAVK